MNCERMSKKINFYYLVIIFSIKVNILLIGIYWTNAFMYNPFIPIPIKCSKDNNIKYNIK